MIVDLTQFWRDHPHYVGTKKEYGVYGVIIDPLLPGVNNQEGSAQVALDHDFIATGVITQMMNLANQVVVGNFPVQVQVLLPGHGGRQLITNAQNQQQKFDWNATMRTSAGNAAAQNSVVWAWPYPALIPAGERITILADLPAPIGLNLRFMVGFQGIKAFL